jgi:serine/threonine-protein kinase
MPLLTGSRLGPYEILSAIGAGGMGEVYRARDSKLGRDVAIKVLPDAFARDSARMERFRREAKILASLNHSNIASIYGLEDSDSTHALVMELAEGPTLADRVRQGPIPIDEALPIARRMADALEYAHEKSVIHRDLKPANIKVAADDTVKILDFGLAKALEENATSLDISTSPTLSRMATMQGVLLGTAAYMSPEQAKAKPVDRRTDIWAFGCVLYEMLTGKMAFSGETVTDTLAAVVMKDPDWSQLPPKTPMRVRVLLQRCLQRDVRQRLQAMGDARISLEEVLSAAPEGTPSLAVLGRPTKRRWLWVTAGIAALLLAGGVAGWVLKPLPEPAAKPVTRFTITLPSGQQLAELAQPALVLSADGSQLAYIATTQSSFRQIYLRKIDNTEAKPIPGTEGAIYAFFSPDGQWLAFFAEGKLRKISVSGGTAQTLADAVNPRGGSWGREGTIVFNNLGSGLVQVSDQGGIAQPLAPKRAPIPGEIGFLWPEFLPSSKAVLFSMLAPSPGIGVQSVGTGELRNLVQGQPASVPRYLPSGHLVFAQQGNLMAVPFDLARLQIIGGAVPVVQGVMEISLPAASQYSVSDTGSLVYVSGGPQMTDSRLVWVSRNGAEQPLAAPVRDYDQPRLSPDGRRVALNLGGGIEGNQVWLYDLARDTLSRFSFGGSSNQWPAWTPDGKRIAFQSSGHIVWQMADGSGGLERLTDTSNFEVPFSWAPDGPRLTFVNLTSGTGDEVCVLNVSDRKTQCFLQTQGFNDAPQFSPDGHWLAYASDESGRREIYVQPYPGPGGKWQISLDGGTEPLWNRNGRELFYRDADKMMAVDIGTQPGFALGKPRQLFEGQYLKNGATYARPNYDVSPDGQRFLMLKPVEQKQSGPTEINVVLNWTEELSRLVPTGK